MVKYKRFEKAVGIPSLLLKQLGRVKSHSIAVAKVSSSHDGGGHFTALSMYLSLPSEVF